MAYWVCSINYSSFSVLLYSIHSGAMSSDKTYQSSLPLAELSPSSADQLRIPPWKAFEPVSALRLFPNASLFSLLAL